MTGKAVYFYGVKFPGVEEYSSTHINLEQPEIDGKSPEEMWAYVIRQVDEQITKIKSIEDEWKVTMGESLVGKTIDEFRGRDYLVADDLQGQAWQVEIRDVQATERWNPAQQQKQKTSCLVFKVPNALFNSLPEQRVLLLNKTDEENIAKMFGPAYGNWVGKTVELHVYRKLHQGRQINKIGIRQTSGQPQGQRQPTQPKGNGTPRPFTPETLREALQKSAAMKAEKLPGPIKKEVAQLVGAFGPKLFVNLDDSFENAEHKSRVLRFGTETYHRLLDWVYPATKDGNISANNIQQAEGISFVNWVTGKQLTPKDIQPGNLMHTFAWPVDDVARQEAELWLANNPVDMPDDGMDGPEVDDDNLITF